jgi:sterol desaturase/sphingolipid hydroxylase (fatty acid hydroxylase superfamily)
MQGQSVAELIPVLQTAIGPVILISGVGLLLLTMTNRLGRAIDRARILAAELPAAGDASRRVIERQLRILWSRARLIRVAIILVSMSALAAAILIIVIFLTALWQLEIAWLISALFVVCMACLIASLVLFIHDINQSLAALKLELEMEGLTDV